MGLSFKEQSQGKWAPHCEALAWVSFPPQGAVGPQGALPLGHEDHGEATWRVEARLPRKAVPREVEVMISCGRS